MRTEPREDQSIFTNEAIDQHQIGPYMAIPIVLPIAGKRMVAMTRFQRRIGCQRLDDFPDIRVKKLAVRPARYPFKIAFERRCTLNLPH